MSKTTRRAPQEVRIKARCAGNGASLAKRRNAEPGRLWGSLRASRWAAIRSVVSACNSSCYFRATTPCGLTAQRLAACGFIRIVVSTKPLMLALTLLLVSCGSSTNPVVGKGDPFPMVELHDLSGNTVYSRELFKGKVVVFNVWATWCPPCRKEMPDLLRLSQILPKKRFMVVALSVDKNLDDVKTFVHEHGLTFPVFWDQGGASIATPKLGVFKYPETLVINREGRVVTKVIGAYPWARADTVKALKHIAKYGDASKE